MLGEPKDDVGHHHIDLRGEPETEPGKPLTQGEWQVPRDGTVFWIWQRPTYVRRFEVRNMQGPADITSIKCGNEEQLVGGTVPAEMFHVGAFGVELVLPRMSPGICLTVKFAVPAQLEIRPVGKQLV